MKTKSMAYNRDVSFRKAIHKRRISRYWCWRPSYGDYYTIFINTVRIKFIVHVLIVLQKLAIKERENLHGIEQLIGKSLICVRLKNWNLS